MELPTSYWIDGAHDPLATAVQKSFSPVHVVGSRFDMKICSR